MTRDDFIYKKARQTWGVEKQILALSEEASELSAAATQYFLGKKGSSVLAEEIADVKIMIEQTERNLNLKEQVDLFKESKLKRLEERLRA